MAKKRITVIGAGGRMGRWFCRHFADLGFEVTGHDPENPVSAKGIKVSDSLVGSILNTEYVMLCTPTRRTPEIIRLIAKEMKKGTHLIDISSEKTKTVSALSKMPAKISPVCIHPMFGPGTRRLKNKNVISVPVRDTKKELAVAKSLLPGASFVTMDAAEHDKRIAVVLGLTHLSNLVFASIISKDEKTGLTDKMAGTTFKVQRALAESILTESPDLIETIISNPELRKVAEEFWKDVGRLLTAVQESKTEEVVEYVKACQERLAAVSDPATSYKRVTSMVSVLER